MKLVIKVMLLSIVVAFGLTTASAAGAAAGAAAMCRGMEATIVGSGGADEIIGTDGSDIIVAYGGDDYIDAGAGDDIVCAGAGNDTVIGGDGDDIIYGHAGDDILFGDHGECFNTSKPYELINNQPRFDFLHACTPLLPGGEDFLVGGAGNDFVSGDERSDRSFGGPGDDVIISGHGSYTNDVDLSVIDRVWGADGNDSLWVFGNARVYGGGGGDSLIAYGALGTLTRMFGGNGDDQINFFGPDDGNSPFELVNNHVQIYGGQGDDDTLAYSEGSITFFGGPGNDTLQGHEGNIGTMRAYGGPGNDVMGTGTGVAGEIVLDGGEGDDTLVPAGGSPLIVRGGEGNDSIYAYGQSSGGPGNDRMVILANSGVNQGGSGDDLIIVERGNSTVEGNSGDDQIYVQPRFDGTISFTGKIDGGVDSDACSDFGDAQRCESPLAQPPFDSDPLWTLFIYWYD